ncbi:MAG: YhbY family RNA-binding protein [archaeon]
MSHPALAKFQIGKNGLTDGTLESLQLALKHHKQVRISILKSACRNREELEKMAKELREKLPVKNHRVIGYTIILIK